MLPEEGLDARPGEALAGELARRGLAVKIDDGGSRALYAVVHALLERFELATPAELEALEGWRARRIVNWAGLEVGQTEVLP